MAVNKYFEPHTSTIHGGKERAMISFRLILFLLLGGLTCPAVLHAYTIFTDEAAFNQVVTSSFGEDFENEAAWGAVRSAGTTINAAATITHQGITWSSPDRISTSLGAGKTGYGLFAHEHQIPDRLAGESSELLLGIGFWARSNTPPAKLHLVLDGGLTVDFNDTTLSTTPIFYGVIVPEGFTRFELVEQEGTLGDAKLFSADSFTFARDTEVNPPPPPGPTDPPAGAAADAGPNRVISEGDSLSLVGSGSGGDGSAIVSFSWEQVSGPPTPLSHPNAAETSLVAPPLANIDADLRFRLTVTDANGGQAQDEVLVMVMENGIGGYPADAYTFYGVHGDPMGMSVAAGAELVFLQAVDPADLATDAAGAPPDQIPYGLFEFELKVPTPGASAEVTFLLPDMADPAADWFKAGAGGWRSLGSRAVIGASGDRATLTLTDGGSFDADGQADGAIHDPSGLAWYTAAAPQAPPDSPDGGGSGGTGGDDSNGGDPNSQSNGGGGGGCFISLLP